MRNVQTCFGGSRANAWGDVIKKFKTWKIYFGRKVSVYLLNVKKKKYLFEKETGTMHRFK